MGLTVTSKRYHAVKTERDETQNKLEELTRELEQSNTEWQEKYDNMEKERDLAKTRQQELIKEYEQSVAEWRIKCEYLERELQVAKKRHPNLNKELRKMKGLSETETPLEAGSFKEEASKSRPWMESWKVKELAALSIECLHTGQKSHDTRGSRSSLVGTLKTKPLDITIVNLSKVTHLEMASSYFHSGKFVSEPSGAIAPGESHTFEVSSKDGRSKTGVKGGIAFAVCDINGNRQDIIVEEKEPGQKEEGDVDESAIEATETGNEFDEATGLDGEREEEKEQEITNNESEETENENKETEKENKETDNKEEKEKGDEPNGEKKERETDIKKKKRFSLRKEKKHKPIQNDEVEEKEEAVAADPEEQNEKTEEPAAEETPQDTSEKEVDVAEEPKEQEETKDEVTDENKVDKQVEAKTPIENTGKDEADSEVRKPEEKRKRFTFRKQKKSNDSKAEKEQENTAGNKQTENETVPESEQTEETTEKVDIIEEKEEGKQEVNGNGTFFVCTFENPLLTGVQKAKSSKTDSKDVMPILKKMKTGSPSKQVYGGHYKNGKRHFVFVWKDPELEW